MAIDKSSRLDIPIDDQREAWNRWNAEAREHSVGGVSGVQAETAEQWLDGLGRRDLNILDAGCGTGWFCQRLLRYGSVTGIDLADEVVQRASARVPQAKFIAGDVFSTALPRASFDVVTSFEVLSHVADQPEFLGQLARLLKPNGLLILATQNRPVLERWSVIGGPIPGQIRHWVDGKTLRNLVQRDFVVDELTSICPVGDQGYLRFTNSRAFDWPAALLLGRKGRTRLKAKLLLGHTLMVRARARKTER
jgi:2-polyprenyl-3-methyl-5-hydroxy-6-metoxy-1,4-benzoquinol methylase